MESWLQEFGATFVYALDRHSHGGSLSMLGSFTGVILAAGICCCMCVCNGWAQPLRKPECVSPVSMSPHI